LRRVFDYLPPAAGAGGDPTPCPGVRVRVPFGRRQLVGILVEVARDSPIDLAKLRPALEILDSRPVFDAVTFDLLRWAADYYHHPLGEVMAAALPASLRGGQAASAPVEVWSLTAAGRAELERPAGKRAPKRRALLAQLGERGNATAHTLAGFKPALLRVLAESGWAAPRALPAAPAAVESRPSEVVLTSVQAGVIEAIRSSLGRFAAHLLYGVTGSGKTEVY
jgi:primosomal protein N' (replication factor Y)